MTEGTVQVDQAERLGWPQWVLLGIGTAGWLGSALSHSLGPAMRGWRTGLERWIVTVDLMGAVVSQWLALVGGLFLMLFALALGRDSRVPAWLRLVLVPACAATFGITSITSRALLDMLLGTALTLIAGSSALLGGAVALRRPATRAAGLVLLLAGLTTLLQLTALRMALRATSDVVLPLLYGKARWVATASLVLQFGALLLALHWLLRGRWMRTSTALLALLVLGIVTHSYALGGVLPTGTSGQVLVARWLQETTRSPLPFTLPALLTFERVSTALVSLALLVKGRHSASLLMGLCLVVGRDADLPALALVLQCAALWAVTTSPGPHSVPDPRTP